MINCRKGVNILGRALLGLRITQTANDLQNKQHQLVNSADKCLQRQLGGTNEIPIVDKTHKKRKDPNFDYKKQYLERNSLHCQTWRGWATHLVKYIADLLATFSPISSSALLACVPTDKTLIFPFENHTHFQCNTIKPWPNGLASRRKSTQVCKTRTCVRTCEGWPNGFASRLASRKKS